MPFWFVQAVSCDRDSCNLQLANSAGQRQFSLCWGLKNNNNIWVWSKMDLFPSYKCFHLFGQWPQEKGYVAKYYLQRKRTGETYSLVRCWRHLSHVVRNRCSEFQETSKIVQLFVFKIPHSETNATSSISVQKAVIGNIRTVYLLINKIPNLDMYIVCPHSCHGKLFICNLRKCRPKQNLIQTSGVTAQAKMLLLAVLRLTKPGHPARKGSGPLMACNLSAMRPVGESLL